MQENVRVPDRSNFAINNGYNQLISDEPAENAFWKRLYISLFNFRSSRRVSNLSVSFPFHVHARGSAERPKGFFPGLFMVPPPNNRRREFGDIYKNVIFISESRLPFTWNIRKHAKPRAGGWAEWPEEHSPEWHECIKYRPAIFFAAGPPAIPLMALINVYALTRRSSVAVCPSSRGNSFLNGHFDVPDVVCFPSPAETSA